MAPRLLLEILVSLSLFSLVSATVKGINANPFTIGIVRLVIASLGVFIFVMMKHSWSEFKRYSNEEKKGLSFIGLAFFVHWLTYFYSIKLSTASLGILVLSTYGVILGAFGTVLRKEPFHQKDLVAGIVCLVGVYFLIPEFSLQNNYTAGVLIGLVSAVFFALVPIAHKKIYHVPLRIRIFYQFFVALIGFLLFFPMANWDLTEKDWGGLVFLGIGATLVAHSLWSSVVSKLPGKTAGLIYFTYIPFSVLTAHFALGEELSMRNLFGGVLIVGGLLIGLLFSSANFLKIQKKGDAKSL